MKCIKKLDIPTPSKQTVGVVCLKVAKETFYSLNCPKCKTRHVFRSHGKSLKAVQNV